MWGKLPAVVGGMIDFMDRALKADPEDSNALKCKVILDEIEEAQFEIDELVKELGEKVQDPIVWQCKCMSPADPHRLGNGNSLIAEHVGDRIIEITPDGEIAWEYTDLNSFESSNYELSVTGRCISIMSPPPGALAAVMVPSCSFTARSVMARPRPVPPVCRSCASETL